MNVRRFAFAAAAATFALLAFEIATRRHAFDFAAMAAYVAVLCGLALFERGRYRSSHATLAGASWQATGERFFDPVTGAATEVFYDPQTGARDYRVR